MAEKSIYVKRLDSIQKQVHTTYLKPNGFAKKGRAFCRKTDDGLYQVICFQIGQTYRGDTNKFWVKVGVRVPEAFEHSLDVPAERDVYHDYHCNIRTDIFQFTESGDYNGFNAKYFCLKDKDTSKIADEIISLIAKYVIPMFKDLESRDKVLVNRKKYKRVTSLHNNTIDLEFAMIYAYKGDMEKANEFINKQYASATHNPGHREYVKEIADKLGLTIQKNC